MRIKQLQEEYTIDLRYTLFPLHPDVPDDGMLLENLFKGRDIDLEAAQSQLKKLAIAEGLEFGYRTMTFNSRRAQELAKWAEPQPGGWKIHNRLYHAYFVDGQNLADLNVLVSLAGELGLDKAKAENILVNRKFSDAVDEDWKRCRKMGVMAVPTYLYQGKKLVGAQTYESLQSLVSTNGAVKK